MLASLAVLASLAGIAAVSLRNRRLHWRLHRKCSSAPQIAYPLWTSTQDAPPRHLLHHFLCCSTDTLIINIISGDDDDFRSGEEHHGPGISPPGSRRFHEHQI